MFSIETAVKTKESIGQKEAIDNVERYIKLRSIQCPGCDGIYTTSHHEETEITPSSLGIKSRFQLQTEIEAKEAWIRENEDVVRESLPRLESEWPNSVANIRSHILSDTGNAGGGAT